jgi:hypothetical protein
MSPVPLADLHLQPEEEVPRVLKPSKVRQHLHSVTTDRALAHPSLPRSEVHRLQALRLHPVRLAAQRPLKHLP